jgi:hypothetical protein
VRLVNPLDVGFFERALLRQRIVDGAVEIRIVAGGVLIPDLEIARRSGQAERADLLKRDLGEGECRSCSLLGTATALFRFNLRYWDTLSRHNGP